MTDYLVPLILLVTALIGLRKGENTYDILLNGAAEGLSLLKTILERQASGVDLREVSHDR